MGASRADAVVEVATDAMMMLMIAMPVTMFMNMLAIVDMRMAMLAAIGVVVRMRMRGNRQSIVVMGVLVGMVVRMTMHRAIRMNVTVFVGLPGHTTFDFHFPRAAATNCTHRPVSFITYSISISLTRMSAPPVGWT